MAFCIRLAVLAAAVLVSSVRVLSLLQAADVTFVKDYFILKQVRKLITITCSKYDAFLLIKTLSEMNLWHVMIEAEELCLDNIFTTEREIQFFRTGLFLDYGCQASHHALRKISERRLLNGSYYWLVLGKWPPEDLDRLLFRMDSDVTWATPNVENGSVSLYDLHKVNYTWPTTVTPAGYWSLSDGLHYTLQDFKYRRRTLQGIVLRAAIVVTNTPTDNLPQRLVSRVNRHLDSLTKFNYALFLLLQDIYNFSMALRPTSSWGYLTGIRSFDGMVGMLQREQVEIAVSSANFKGNRFEVVDYTFHSWKFRPCFLFRHPPMSSKGNVLLKPFNSAVWLSLAAVVAMVVILMRFVYWVEVRYRLLSVARPVESSWGAVVVFATGAITQQGTQVKSAWITWHIIVLVSFITGVLVNSYYSASIVSSLLAPPPRSIRTLRDLIDSPLQVGIEDISYNRDYFLHTTDPLGIELYHKKVKPPGRQRPAFYSLSQGVYRMQHEKFAFHAEVAAVYPLIEENFSEQDKCAITEILLVPVSVMSVPIQKKSPLKELMTYGMRKATERGLMARELHIWQPQKPRCMNTGRVPVVEINVLLPAYILLAAGIGGSLVILITEAIRRYRSTKVKQFMNYFAKRPKLLVQNKQVIQQLRQQQYYQQQKRRQQQQIQRNRQKASVVFY